MEPNLDPNLEPNLDPKLAWLGLAEGLRWLAEG